MDQFRCSLSLWKYQCQVQRPPMGWEGAQLLVLQHYVPRGAKKREMARRHGSAKSYGCAGLPGLTHCAWHITEGSGDLLQWMCFGNSISLWWSFPMSEPQLFFFFYVWKLLMRQNTVFFCLFLELPWHLLEYQNEQNHLAEKNRFRHTLAMPLAWLLYYITSHNYASSGKRHKSTVCGKLHN